MPELPEVETIARALAPALLGHSVERVAVHAARLRAPLAAASFRPLVGRPFREVRRRAKFILAATEGPMLVIHLGMTGSLRMAGAGEARRKHDHAEFFLDDGQALVYNDPRRFGLLECLPDGAAFATAHADLGVEPLEREFSGKWLFERSRKIATPIKPWLMKQEVVVGVGNIYACEALFLSGIAPKRAAQSLSADECASLARHVKNVLRQSIKSGGTTFSDYRQLNGEEGHFVQKLSVYGRAGQPCPRCGAPIERCVQGGRSTFFCPHCQGAGV
ncbi:MAG: bifunctional DNA-formamidopyrimidine glycosylase/DNA-(apurinic or apyrimidinic site) lyase [Planctomycetes bacterium]|nr:bifunctional DNA-formamidopyrimidine glycosylase/DNA-(apurinic or apyrimidinic site) lyase [Planctomycetota bacterium]